MEARGGNSTLGWLGLGLLGTLWVLAHRRIAALLDRLDRTWDPPRFLDTVALMVGSSIPSGLAASLLLPPPGPPAHSLGGGFAARGFASPPGRLLMS